MKEISQKRFFITYGISLVFYSELFMLLAIVVIAFSRLAMFPTLLVLLLAPLLGGIVALHQTKKNKIILLKNDYKTIFYIVNGILYLAIYFFNLKFNIILFLTFMIGAIIACVVNKKKIEKIKIEYKEEEKEDFFKKEQKTRKYEFEKFNTENIKEFLKINKVDTNKFLLGKVKPIKKEYILWKNKEASKYIICFDDKDIRFYEIIQKSKEYIEKGFILEIDKLSVKKGKEGLFNYKLEIEIENEGTRFYLYIPKKLRKIEVQIENGKALYDLVRKM